MLTNTHQRYVALVQCAHGRHKAYCPLRCPKLFSKCAEGLDFAKCVYRTSDDTRHIRATCRHGYELSDDAFWDERWEEQCVLWKEERNLGEAILSRPGCSTVLNRRWQFGLVYGLLVPALRGRRRIFQPIVSILASGNCNCLSSSMYSTRCF
jgi:hypothetical protein